VNFLDDFEGDSKSSHDQVEKKSNTKLKPRFSINLSDEDFSLVKEYCESRSVSASVLARMTLLDKIKG
jgi:3-hydroxyisobutyrate dehydrogenase-like beta-hydroxyacid dehydrogenase